MEASREMKMQKCDVSSGCKLCHGTTRVAELASELCLELWSDSCELHRQHLSCQVMENYVMLCDTMWYVILKVFEGDSDLTE
jgi:hypothetical protein